MSTTEAIGGPAARGGASALRPEKILDALGEGVIAMGPDGHIVFANATAERLLGYSPGELIAADGRGHDLLHHTHADGTPFPFEECPTQLPLKEGGFVRVGAEDGEVLWRKDGTSFPVTYAATPIVQDGETVGVTLVFRDVTERLRLQDEHTTVHREAAESEKLAAMGTLVSGVSHEVKTPLTIFLNNLFLTRSALKPADDAQPERHALWEKVEPRFAEMESAVDRISRLVGGLRRFSRLDETEAIPSALEDVVAEAARLFQLAYRSTVRVELDLRETRPVLVDAYKVQQLLLNLLENGADATAARGGRVRVLTTMSDDQQRAVLLVEDDGEGMTPQVMRDMHNPLFTTRRDRAGLGLAIVKRIADEHEAVIECESSPGEGTRFSVSFPIAPY